MQKTNFLILLFLSNLFINMFLLGVFWRAVFSETVPYSEQKSWTATSQRDGLGSTSPRGTCRERRCRPVLNVYLHDSCSLNSKFSLLISGASIQPGWSAAPDRHRLRTGYVCYWSSGRLSRQVRNGLFHHFFFLIYSGHLLSSCSCHQEGVGDPSTGDSRAVLRDAVRSGPRCSLSHCFCTERSYMVLFR